MHIAPAVYMLGRRLGTPRGTHRPLLPFGPGGVKQVSAVPRRLHHYSEITALCQLLGGAFLGMLKKSEYPISPLFERKNPAVSVVIVDSWRRRDRADINR